MEWVKDQLLKYSKTVHRPCLLIEQVASMRIRQSTFSTVKTSYYAILINDTSHSNKVLHNFRRVWMEEKRQSTTINPIQIHHLVS